MTKDTVERAIKRGSGSADGENFEEVRYEGYGPNGVAIMVDCLTDNRNRTVSEVRHAFNKAGGNLGTDGSVAYLFTKRGILSFPPDSDEERIMEAAIEAGAEDVVTNEDGSIDVLTAPDDYLDVKQTLTEAGLKPQNSELMMQAATEVTLEGEEEADKVIRLVDTLEDLDDVQNVYTNADFTDEALASLQ